MWFVALVFAADLAHGIWLAFSSLSNQAQRVPDDAYYYFSLARNFVERGRWTFDGVTVTTGFHLLHGYALTLVYRLARLSGVAFPSAVIIFTTLVGVAALALIARGLRRVGWCGLAAAVIVSSAVLTSRNAVSGMEWSLAVLASALYFTRIDGVLTGKQPVTSLSLGVITATGLFGTLSRSDFPLIPACILAATLFARRTRGPTVQILPSVLGLFGACLGLVVLALHTHSVTGEWMQDSAKVKAFWGITGEHQSFTRFPMVVSSLIVPRGALLWKAAAAALGVFFLALGVVMARANPTRTVPRDLRGLSPADLTAVLASLLALLGYELVYARSGAMLQPWYTAHVTVPTMVLLTAALSALRSALPKRAEECTALACAAISVFNVGTWIAVPTFVQQQRMYLAGVVLRTQFPGVRAAAWNAGVMNYYFDGGTLMNLDGLVNHDVFDSIRGGTLAEYILSQRIEYLSDFDQMYDPEKSHYTGLSPDFVAHHLDRVVSISAADTSKWRDLVIYHVRPTASAPPIAPQRFRVLSPDDPRGRGPGARALTEGYTLAPVSP